MPDRSVANKKSAVTRAANIVAISEKSLLAGRLRTRSTQGARTAALKKEPVLIIKGVTNPKYREIHPDDHKSLEIPDYQRAIQPGMVNSILRALMGGGVVVDPITLSRRTWAGEKAGKYYIVDGQQRAMAHIEAGKTIKAILYDVDSPEAERQLFVVLNTQKTVNPNNIILASGNKVAIKLREHNEEQDHPLCGRIYFMPGTARGKSNIAATVVLKGLVMALGLPSHVSGRAMSFLLPALDAAYDDKTANAYYSLLAQITPEGAYLRVLVAIAIGKVFAEKVQQYGHPIMPNKVSIQSLRRVNWEKATMGSWSMKFLPMVMEQVRDRWKA